MLKLLCVLYGWIFGSGWIYASRMYRSCMRVLRYDSNVLYPAVIFSKNQIGRHRLISQCKYTNLYNNYSRIIFNLRLFNPLSFPG